MDYKLDLTFTVAVDGFPVDSRWRTAGYKLDTVSYI